MEIRQHKPNRAKAAKQKLVSREKVPIFFLGYREQF